MRNLFPDPICWFEGMPLLPQHFQMQALHATGHAALLAGAARPHYWGVLALDQEEAGLSEGLVRITRLDAILPDGLAIRHAPEDPVLQIDARPAFSSPEQVVTVYLAVPPLYRGGQLDRRGTRYRQHQSEGVPDLSTGESPASLTSWRPRLHLLTDLGDQEYERLPLMRLRLQGGGVVPADYAPPCPFVAPGDKLGEHVMRVAVRTREKCVFLSGRLDAARRAGENDDADQIARQLSALWMRLPEIEAALATRAVHPLDLYCKLAGMSGALAGLRPGNGVPVFPGFDYTELLASFEPLIDWIETALATIRQGYRVRQFTAEPGGFWIDTPTGASPSPQKELVIGLRMPAQASEADASAWLEQTAIGSREHLPALTRQRMRGLARRSLLREERAAYSVGDDTAMFALTLDNAWFDPSQALHIEVRPGMRGIAPWAVQLFTPESDGTSANEAGGSGSGDA